MPIETKDLVLYESERLTDTEDGGGKYNGQIISDGQSNNLFNDVSELDRTMGDVSMRKIFPAVTTSDTDLLMGATIFVSELPKDPNVSALIFSTGSWTDQRSAAQGRVENYLGRGGQIAGVPLDTQGRGMRALQCVMFPEEAESAVGDTIILVSNEGKQTEHEQFVKITKVEARIAIMIINDKPVQYKIATYTLNDPLDADYVGLSARQWYSGAASTTIIRESVIADTGLYYSSTQLKEDAGVGEYTVNAQSMFTQLIPSAQTETPILDIDAAAESTVLVPGRDGTITANFQVNVGVDQNLFIGSSVMPSSMSFTLAGQSISDQGGLLKNAQGTQVGTVDYQRGLIQWTASATTGNYNLAITFTPAATPKQRGQSFAIPVTIASQSMNFTGVLVPKPSAGSLTISYMSQGRFYELHDDGSGQLKGSNASFGSGIVNYETGTWLLTTGELPDVDSVILLQWGTPITTFSRANLAVMPAKFEFDLEQEGLAASSVVVTWLLEGVGKTATSNAQGKFTGDATGEINYASGKGFITPNKLPQKSTVFTINYSYGTSLTQQKTALPDVDQKLIFTIGTGTAIQPNSIEFSMYLRSEDHSASALNVIFRDVPVNASTGNIINEAKGIVGTVVYATGAVEMIPKVTQTKMIPRYEPVSYATYGAA